jgi:hypothetical protein
MVSMIVAAPSHAPDAADLAALVAAELAVPVQPPVREMAAAIAALHPGARAVLFYGSCLREARLDGLMLDFYLIVDDYRAAYSSRWLAWANALIPPNVFPFAFAGMSAKYAVLSMADFHRLCGAETRNVSVWARFSQPSRLVWTADAATAAPVTAAVARAAPALLAAALPFERERGGQGDPLDLWRRAYALTYAAELRAERGGRAASVVDADPDRYRAFTAPAIAAIDPRTVATPQRARIDWWRRRWEGKALTILRLMKATFTFAGGIDYLAWKINRHAGTAITISDWQRRHPILAALSLLPRLMRGGAVR